MKSHVRWTVSPVSSSIALPITSLVQEMLVALMKDGKLHVWSHTQGVYQLRGSLAEVMKLDPKSVTVSHVEGAGCYGHNGADDVALDAALLARAANGRPVRLQWMRDDEFAWEPYGAAMSMTARASLDADNKIADWHYELWSNTHSMRPRDTSPDEAAWKKSVAQFRRDLKAMQALVADPSTDLFAPIAWGDGQTILREALLTADHNAYHIGELIAVRRLLGAWGK